MTDHTALRPSLPSPDVTHLLDLRDDVVGVDEPVPLLDGRLAPYVNLDNAASTPPFRSVVETLERFLPYYSSVHRGTGYKSRVSTAAYEDSRELVGRFVGADPERDVVLFGKNTTEAINTLAQALPLSDDAVVLTTQVEHHSNDLPWRSRARIEHVRALPDGRLDIDDLDRRLAEHAGKVAILAVSGASNVTGLVQPVHLLAERVHAVGGRIVVDAAQLAAHRKIDMLRHDDPRHLDFLALSAHKMYSPYGTGALIGDRSAFRSSPQRPGGGTIRAVTLDDVAWADLPDREEAGTPNVIGAVALAAAVQQLSTIGLDRLTSHERQLTGYAMARLRNVSGLRITGPVDRDALSSKVGVVSFTLDGFDHGLVAAVLGYEHGIGVRSGCFCAQPYVHHLLQVDPARTRRWFERLVAGDNRGGPGLVRISLGCYSNIDDIDRAVDALERVTVGEVEGTYVSDLHGTYRPDGYEEPRLFALDR